MFSCQFTKPWVAQMKGFTFETSQKLIINVLCASLNLKGLEFMEGCKTTQVYQCTNGTIFNIKLKGKMPTAPQPLHVPAALDAAAAIPITPLDMHPPPA